MYNENIVVTTAAVLPVVQKLIKIIYTRVSTISCQMNSRAVLCLQKK